MLCTVKMTWLFIFLIFLVEAWTSIGGEQCCFLYGSVPRNDSNCFPEGRQLVLNYVIFNPHDTFTNLKVRWFRNVDVARAASSTEEITNIQNEYEVLFLNSSVTSLITENCTIGAVYRDLFILAIYNFTSEKNGYYWCQILVNNTVSQPSQYAWFYAADSSSCTQQSHFKQAAVPECAEFNNTFPTSTTDVVENSTLESDNLSTISTTSMSTVTQAVHSERRLMLAIIGSLAVLVVILGVLVTLMVSSYIFKQCQKNNSGKLSHVSVHSTIEKETVNNDVYVKKDVSEGSSCYQTLNLDEMDYESMYSKIATITKDAQL